MYDIFAYIYQKHKLNISKWMVGLFPPRTIGSEVTDEVLPSWGSTFERSRELSDSWDFLRDVEKT